MYVTYIPFLNEIHAPLSTEDNKMYLKIYYYAESDCFIVKYLVAIANNAVRQSTL